MSKPATKFMTQWGMGLIAFAAGTTVLSGCSQFRVVKNHPVEQPPIRFIITDTMQNTCFDHNGSAIICPTQGSVLYGQDAQFEGVQSSFTDNGDQTITDNRTGLMWQKTPNFKLYQYTGANTYCQKLTLGRYHDWRLPTIKELYSLTDFSGKAIAQNTNVGPVYIDTNYFDVKSHKQTHFTSQYWSKTKYPLNSRPISERTDIALGVNFADSQLQRFVIRYFFLTDSEEKITQLSPNNFVRCTRGKRNIYGVNNFTSNGDGTVTDNATGLMWQQSDDEVRRSWPDALAYAKETKLAGYTDWRLPNIKELQSIMQYDKQQSYGLAIDASVFNLSGDPTLKAPLGLWSNTTLIGSKQTAAFIDFDNAYPPTDATAISSFGGQEAGVQPKGHTSGRSPEHKMPPINANHGIRSKNYTLLVRDLR